MEWQRISEHQGGVIGREQLAESGLTRHEIDALVRGGRLRPEPWCPGPVYRVNGAEIGPRGRAWALVLGVGATVSYHTAAQLWALPVDDDRQMHVTVPQRLRVNRRAGVKVHRVLLPGGATTRLHGIPVTTKVETVFDCLGALPPGKAMSLADRALQQRWITTSQLASRLRRQPGRWGNVQLRAILDRLDPAVEAESERRFHELLRSAGIAGWVAQYVVSIGGRQRRVDVAFPDRKIAIEIDGRGAHAHAEAFADDRRRQNDLVRAGWTVLRYTWDDIVNRPHAIIAEILELLAR